MININVSLSKKIGPQVKWKNNFWSRSPPSTTEVIHILVPPPTAKGLAYQLQLVKHTYALPWYLSLCPDPEPEKTCTCYPSTWSCIPVLIPVLSHLLPCIPALQSASYPCPVFLTPSADSPLMTLAWLTSLILELTFVYLLILCASPWPGYCLWSWYFSFIVHICLLLFVGLCLLVGLLHCVVVFILFTSLNKSLYFTYTRLGFLCCSPHSSGLIWYVTPTKAFIQVQMVSALDAVKHMVVSQKNKVLHIV